MKRILFVFGFFISSFLLPVNAQVSTGDPVTTVYPNPTKESIQIKVSDPGVKIRLIQIYSILGAQVMSFSANNTTVELNLTKLRSGKYLVQSQLSDGRTQVNQIVKQ